MVMVSGAKIIIIMMMMMMMMMMWQKGEDKTTFCERCDEDDGVVCARTGCF